MTSLVDSAPRESRTGDLPHAGRGVRDRPVRFGIVRLGNVVGTLLAGVVIGQIGVTIPALVKVDLLRSVPVRDRLQGRPAVLPRPQAERADQVALTVVLCVTSLVVTVVFAKLLRYDTARPRA